LIPEITKAFHKSSFTDKCPRSLNFDEFLQCIIRMANELLSRKKKLKYRYPESRVSLFLAKLHLRPFPKEEGEMQANTLSDVVARDKMTDPNKKSIGSELTQKMNEENPAMNNFDYRLSEKQLDSEFDLYFNTGGFFSDANSSITGTPSADIPKNNHANKEMNPLSPSMIGSKKKMLKKKGKKIYKNVRPSPLQKKSVMKKGKKMKKNVQSSYQTLHPQTSPPLNYQNNNFGQQYQAMNAQQQPMQQMQMQMGPMQVPMGNNGMYLKPGYQRQSQSSTSGYSDYFDQRQQNQMQTTMPLQHPYAMNLNLTEQEQALLQSINQRQQNHLNRAVQPSQRANHHANQRRHR